MTDCSTEDSPAAEDGNVLRDQATNTGQLRFFHVAEGKARGKSGGEDVREFVEVLELLQLASVRIGGQLEMNAVSHCAVRERNRTVAYRFDPSSDPQQPQLVGALADRRVPLRELLAQMGEQGR